MGQLRHILSRLYKIDGTAKSHAINVSNISGQIAIAMNLSKSEVSQICLAGRYHDIGKIFIKPAILTKNGSLTSLEWEEMKTHTQQGYELLLSFKKYQHLAYPALQHHERWDGKGYPYGLKEEEIVLSSRIIAVADAFDAMIAKRPYKNAYTIAKAIEEIKLGAGKQFDPHIAMAFAEMMTSSTYFFDKKYNLRLQVAPSASQG